MRNMLDRFNHRHRAGFCLTLLAAGFALLLGDSVKQTVAILLIGLATTWFIASLRRAPGVVFSSIALCLGLWVAVLPVWNDWQSYRVALHEFEAARQTAMARKARPAPSVDDRLSAGAARILDKWGSSLDWDSPVCWDKAERALAKAFIPVPDEEFAEHYCDSPTLVPAFSLRGCITWHRVASAGGFPLALFGALGILSLIRKSAGGESPEAGRSSFIHARPHPRDE